MMQSIVSQSFVSILMLVSLLCRCHWAVAQGQPDKIDSDRAQRYVEKLVELQEARVQLRKRAASLLAQNPNLEQEFVAAMRTQMVTAGRAGGHTRFHRDTAALADLSDLSRSAW